MKVLHIVPSYLPAYEFGGPVKTVHELCASLVKKGLKISVFTTNIKLEGRKEIEVNKEYIRDGVGVTYFPISFPRQYCYSARLADALKKRIKDFDIIHLHSVYRYTTLIGARLCRMYNKPYILNPFGAIDPSMINLKGRFKKTLYIELFEKSNIENAAAIHAASDFEKEAFLSMGFKRPVVIIPPGLNMEEYSRPEGPRLRTRFPVLDGKKIMLFLGRIHPKKGLDLLAGAFKAVCEKRDDVFLVIAGPGEIKYVNKVKRLFENTGVYSKIIFTGALLEKEKVSALYESDIFILPSYGENFGIAVLEAMACGSAVIITNKVGLSPEVKECHTGIVTDCDQKEIAEAVLALLNDDDMRKTMGENGIRLVKERFTNDESAEKAVKIYNEIDYKNLKFPHGKKLPISIIIITYNEEKNIKKCLDAVAGWAGEILVIDSGSTDSTREIARLYTDKIYEHPFENYARQRNWAQNSLPITNEWVFHLDADEEVSPGLFSELYEAFRSDPRVDGFMMPRKTIFRGRWIKYGGHYPSYHLRLFRKDKGKSEERFHDQNYIVNGRTAMLKGDIINTVTPDISALIAKHKVELEAREILYNNERTLSIKFNGTPIERINWLRYKVYYGMPLFIRPILYFLYRYFLRLGFLDGGEGLVFHFRQGFWFRLLVDMKIFELKCLKNGNTRD